MNVAKSNARLTRDQILSAAPAVGAFMPHPHMSETYSFVNTSKLIDEIVDAGWFPISAQQVSARTEVERLSAPHQIWFATEEDLANAPVGRMFSAFMLGNSHNGVKRASFSGMWYRKACMNGMCLPVSVIQGINVKHKTSTLGDDGTLTVSDAISELMGRFGVLNEIRNHWESVQTSGWSREEYANRAETIRSEVMSGDRTTRPLDLLRTRRGQDGGLDLASLYNVVEENVRKGGLTLPPDAVSGRLRSTREIKGLDTLRTFHERLFDLTQEFARQA